MMFKMNQLAVGLFLFLSSLFSCQQKGDFKSMNVDDFDNLIQNEDIQRLDVRTLAEYSEGHIAKTININVMDDSFASMADSLLQKDKPVAVYCRSGKRSKKAHYTPGSIWRNSRTRTIFRYSQRFPIIRYQRLYTTIRSSLHCYKFQFNRRIIIIILPTSGHQQK